MKIITSITLTKLAILLFTLSTGLPSYAAQSVNIKEAKLELKPAKCVSLHQGQTCYADVELTWQSPITNDFCLLSSTQTQPLACWQQSNHGHFEGEIASDSNVVFTLVVKGNTKPLASAQLKMAWVYKKKRSSVTWRVF